MAVAGALLTFFCVLAIGIILYVPMYKCHYDSYTIRIRPRKSPPEPSSLSEGSLILSVLKPAGEFVLAVCPGALSPRARQLLLEADYRSTRHIAVFLSIQLIAAGGTALGTLVWSGGDLLKLLLIMPSALVAWMMPTFFLAAVARKRQQQIVREIPTVVDLLVVCAQAGFGLLMSIEKVSRETAETAPCLAGELQLMLQHIKVFGKSTSSALRDLDNRCGVPELSGLTSALIACEAKGSDISYPLKQQSEAIRERIKRKSEEEASKTPVKMVPVIMVFIMPLVLYPMLGPAVVIIIQALWPALNPR
jgi:tight adherence protein C